MSIQLLLMKSGEEVIADVYEIRDAEQKPQGFILRDPQICKIFSYFLSSDFCSNIH